MVAEQARARRPGRGRLRRARPGRDDRERVEHWLRDRAGVAGYLGFAVGRTIWADEVTATGRERSLGDDAVTRIAANYLRAIDALPGRGPARPH